MRVGVLSDTHLRAGRVLPTQVWKVLDGVDLILHAGDVVSPYVLTDLACLAPVVTVRGNCDGWDLAHLPPREIVVAGEVTIGLVHGYQGLGRTTEDRAYRAFDGEKVNVIVFGHSHVPFSGWQHGVLMFNPGSPTDKRGQAHYSLGLLDIDSGNVQAEHYYF